jgi:hypothetical protein
MTIDRKEQMKNARVQIEKHFLDVSNMISKRVILDTINSIRLACEVANYLAKEALAGLPI